MFRRRPAWTDRVLYKSPKNCYSNVALSADQTSYRSHPGYNISDHKPVTSEFAIKVSYSSSSRIKQQNMESKTLRNQVFEDPTEKVIEFSTIQIWQIGENNKIEYTVPNGYEEAESDWIGVFKVR